MSVPSGIVLGLGVGVALAVSPLFAVGCAWAADRLSDWNWKHEGLAEWGKARVGWGD